MSTQIDDLLGYVIDRTSREVIKTIKSNPRSIRLALQLPIVNKVKENDLYEVFPIYKDGIRGFVYLPLKDK